ncbi:MAG TPA: hypothetical protein PK275_10585 [Chitinophagaceae bacterium]|nr:hypothetical protein [Chitinophagaceae bacterium]
MKLKQVFFAISLFIFSSIVSGQTKYKGVLFTKLGQEIKGDITFNKDGINEDLIEITTYEKSKVKGGKLLLKTNTKLNVALIKFIIIAKQTYYFRDIKIDYNDKYMQNVCVKLIYGTIDCGLFQSGDGTVNNSVGIKFPNEALSKLESIDFEYYNNSTAVTMRVSKCESLVEKMINNDEAVTWTEANTRDQRIQRIKNIIDEYNSCKLKN